MIRVFNEKTTQSKSLMFVLYCETIMSIRTRDMPFALSFTEDEKRNCRIGRVRTNAIFPLPEVTAAPTAGK